MQLAPARVLLAKINRIVEDFGPSGDGASRLELDLLREYVRHFYEAIADNPAALNGAHAAASTGQSAVNAEDPNAKPLDLGRARERFSGASGSTAELGRTGSVAPRLIQVSEEVEADSRRIEANRLAEQAKVLEQKQEEARLAQRRDAALREVAQREAAAREQEVLAEAQAKALAQREQAQREAAQREVAREQEVLAQAQREQAAKEAAQKEAAQREAIQREAAREQEVAAQAQREQAAREAAAREAAARESAAREQEVLAQAQREQAAERERMVREASAHATLQTLANEAWPAAAATEVSELPAMNREMRELFTIEKATDLSDRLANSPIADLTRAMALNEQLQVRSELFGGSPELMNSTLLRLNGLGNFEDAVRILAETARQFDWTEEERRPTARTFVKLVRRRYV